MHQPARPTGRTTRGRATAALAGALAGGLVATFTSAVAPAQGAIAWPVNCEVDKVVLEHDGQSFDLHGNCGVVVVKADDAQVSMPTARKLVVRGHGNEVVAKPLTTLVVRGHDNTVSAPTVRTLRLASPGSRISVDGLLEKAVLDRRRGTVTADQVSDLMMRGKGHRLHARRGYDARIASDGSRVGFRRLDRVVVTGDDNRVRVRRGETSVRVDGSGNLVRVHRRG